MADVLILNGPNLNLLGSREPDVYGATTLDDLETLCIKEGKALGLSVNCQQSNHEGELVTLLQRAGAEGIWVVFNPGAYTHTSIAIRDAITGADCNVIEVHISNIHAREAFRHQSMISAVVQGSIVGFGIDGYKLALQAIKQKEKN